MLYMRSNTDIFECACKDLLEMNRHDDDENTYHRCRVDFLHRTVRDFLEIPDMKKLLEGRAGAEFDPLVSLCRNLLAQIKALPVKVVSKAD